MPNKSKQLRANFLLPGMGAAVLLAGGVAIVGSQHARRTLAPLAEAQARAVDRRIAAQVSSYVGERRREVERLALSPPIVSAARRGPPGHNPELQALLRAHTRRSDLTELLLTDDRGVTLSAAGGGGATGASHADEPWWRSAWRDGSSESEVRRDSTVAQLLRYAIVVRPSDGARPIGVVRASVPVERLIGALDLADLTNGAYLQIVDQGGAVVATTQATPLATSAEGGELIVSSPANAGRWQVALRQPIRRAYAVARTTERAILIGAAALFVVMVLLVWRLAGWLETRITAPVRAAGVAAGRVAGGDLSVTVTANLVGTGDVGDLLTSVHSMVLSLRRLVGAIRSAAEEAAAMAAEISASTEQMSASTEEMSATCQDLSRRAAEQAQLVRAAADDATKIFEIVTVLAAGAEDSVRRNTNVSTLAQRNREVLDESTAQLLNLTEEVARGVTEADALASASQEIQKFVAQAKTVATQTNMLALNAAIEAARAGPQGRGFAVVADEVRKLASVAAHAAGETADIVRVVQTRVQATRNRLTALAQGSTAARAAAQTAAQGLATVTAEAGANEAWSREIAKSMIEMRGIAEEIANRLANVAQGTEGLLAASEEIAASSEEQSASTEEIAASANQLAEASDRLNDAVKSFRLLAEDGEAKRQAAD
jgi:methyl-accepting chemotaxis protein